MNTTDIEYLDRTWNPVTGCTPCSPGCANCWAKSLAETRLRGRYGYDADDPFRVTFHPNRLEEPLKLRKPSRIGVCFMGDLFHDEVKRHWLAHIMDIICAYDHTYLVLTKRPHNILSMMRAAADFAFDDYPLDVPWRIHLGKHKGLLPSNIHLGVTVCNQAEADEKIPQLLQIPAAVRWISYEPALGPVNIPHDFYVEPGKTATRIPGLDWVVAGCEKRKGGRPGRPMEIDWAWDMRDQCLRAGVPFYMKQLAVNGKVTSDMAKFPEDLQIRQMPA